MEHSTSSGTRWEANVFLRQAFGYIPDNSDEWDEKFPHWQRRTSSKEIFFCQTKDPNQLGSIIHRAQLAILNPNTDQARYVPGSINEIHSTDRRAEFSPNVVCIYMSAPEYPNLSFYDLPGVIISRGNRNKELLKTFIENLVTEYIRDSYSLVILTSSLEIDWDIASNAADLVHKANATGRCVG